MSSDIRGDVGTIGSLLVEPHACLRLEALTPGHAHEEILAATHVVDPPHFYHLLHSTTVGSDEVPA